jgi:hypothetical protein
MSIEILPLVIGVTFLAVWALVAGIVVQARRESRRSYS